MVHQLIQSYQKLFKIAQLGGIIHDTPQFGNILLNIARRETDVARNLTKKILDKYIDMFNKEYITCTGLWITLTIL